MIDKNVSIDDFDEVDFLSPISLLAALQKVSSQEADNNHTEVVAGLLTVSDIKEKYGLSSDYINSALLAGTIVPAKLTLYFNEDDVERIVAESTTLNPLMNAFEKELDKMAMNYSYKPLLLLALFESKDLSATVEDIITFYFNYYSKRAENQLSILKGYTKNHSSNDSREARYRSSNGKNEVATEIIVYWLLGQCYNGKAVTGCTAVEVTTGTKDENRINRKCPPRK